MKQMELRWTAGRVICVWLLAGLLFAPGEAARAEVEPPKDDFRLPVVGLSATQPETAEPGPNIRVMPGRLVISRSGEPTESLVVICRFGGTATFGTDYRLDPEPGSGSSFTLPAGARTLEILVQALEDKEVEGVETVIAELALPGPEAAGMARYQIDPNRSRARVIIHDSTPRTIATLVIRHPADGLSFRLGTPVLVQVAARDPESFLPVVELFAGEERVGVSNIAFFREPDPGTTIDHEILWSDPPPGLHTLRARAVRHNGETVESGPVTIRIEREFPSFEPVVIEVVAEGSVTGDPGPITLPVRTAFVVKRVAGPLEVAVPLTFEISGSATPGEDYVPIPATLRLPAGERALRIPVVALAGSPAEATKTVVFTLQPPLCPAIYPPPAWCYQLGRQSRAVISIFFPPAEESVFVRRQLPGAYLAGATFRVRLEVSLPRGASAWAVEDQPPTGWRVDAISNEGGFDPATGKVKFGPFTELEPRELHYSVTVPADATGRHEFRGWASIDGRRSVVGGDTLLVPAQVHHPADRAPTDMAITMDEATAYTAAWKTGRTWPVGPWPIPLSFVTRAGMLWQGDERYVHDPVLGEPPLCWVNRDPAATPRPSTVTEDAWSGSAERALPEQADPGRHLTVSLMIQPPPGTRAWAVEETLPREWEALAIHDEGWLEPVNRQIRWGLFLDDQPRELQYQVRTPAGIVSVGSFHGQAAFDGIVRTLTGRREVVSGDATTAVRFTTVPRSPDGPVRFRIEGGPGQVLVIETSTDLVRWTPVAPVRLSNGTVTFEDESGTGDGARFYRARPTGP